MSRWHIESMHFNPTEVYVFNEDGTVDYNGKRLHCPNNCYSCTQVADRLACAVCGFYLVPVGANHE